MLQAKQATPPLAEGIDNDGAQEQADGNANGNLNNRVADIKGKTIERTVRRGAAGDRRAVEDLRAIRGVAGDLVRGGNARDQRTVDGKPARHLHEDGGQHRRGGETVAHPARLADKDRAVLEALSALLPAVHAKGTLAELRPA